MDPHFLVDGDRVVDRGVSIARDRNFNWSRATVGEIGRSLERPALERQISRVSLGTRDSFGRVFRGACFRELANRTAVPRNSDFDWLLADLWRRTLFVGRDLRGRAWNPLRACRLANWQSKIESRKLSGRPNDGLALLNA